MTSTDDTATRTLPFCRPPIGDAEVAEVVRTLEGDWLTTGPRTQRFGEVFAQRVGAPEALPVNSCTGALHLALLALGVGEGDAVFTTTMTFASTVHVIEHVGASPVLVDIDPLTSNLDPTALARAVDELPSSLRPAAVIPVHYAGLPCDMAPIVEVARRHDMAVVEDAAHGIPGQSVDGRPMGQPVEGLRHATAFSFYATKNLVTGEGGMLTASADLVDEARLWSLHGMSRDAWKRYGGGASWFYEVVRPGFKYNMTDLQAALGLIQLERLDEMQQRRGEIVARYDEAFRGLDQLVTPPAAPAGTDHAHHLYVVQVVPERLGIDRNEFIEALAALGVSTSVHFIPVHQHRYYRDRYDFADGDFPVAERTFERIVSLPLFSAMSDDDVDHVVDAVRATVTANAR